MHVRHLGIERVIGAWLVDEAQIASERLDRTLVALLSGRRSSLMPRTMNRPGRMVRVDRGQRRRMPGLRAQGGAVATVRFAAASRARDRSLRGLVLTTVVSVLLAVVSGCSLVSLPSVPFTFRLPLASAGGSAVPSLLPSPVAVP